MKEFIQNQALKLAKIVHAGTKDFEKLTLLQARVEKELAPYTVPENRLEFLASFENEVEALFKQHISECTKVDSCPQHKTHNNILFLIAQEKARLPNHIDMTSKTKMEIKHLLDIFISHSSQDAEIARLLIELIRSALNISADKIRCTSVTGYRLPVGASTDDQLRAEIFDARVFIAIISPNSNNSMYVAFELGARWGNRLPLFPLITNKMGAELLKGPLKNISALNACNRGDLFQLISDLGNELGKEPEQPSVYEGKLDELVNHSLKETLPPTNLEKPANTAPGVGENNFSDAETIIKSHCQRDWPDDYTMQLHCIQQQKQAVRELKMPRPDDISETEFAQIRKKAMTEWPMDFVMQLHAQKTQIDSFRQLRNQ